VPGSPATTRRGLSGGTSPARARADRVSTRWERDQISARGGTDRIAGRLPARYEMRKSEPPIRQGEL
jgi:hypothetical protein